jgi:hypothetical protein
MGKKLARAASSIGSEFVESSQTAPTTRKGWRSGVSAVVFKKSFKLIEIKPCPAAT